MTGIPPFSFFIPFRLYDTLMDLRRLCGINLRSIDNFFDLSLLDKVVVMTRREDLADVREAVKSQEYRFQVEVLCEDVHYPCLAGCGGSGWFRQQVLKLSCADFIRSQYVILSDDDVVITRSVGRTELFHGDRLVMSHLEAGNATLSSYFDSSCFLLDYPRERIHAGQRVLNVTPEIMVTAELKNVMLDLQRRWKVKDTRLFLMEVSRGWSSPLPNHRIRDRVRNRLTVHHRNRMRKIRERAQNWSEYTLYWAYLLREDRTDYYYDYNVDEHARQLNDEGIWSNDEAVFIGIDGWMERTFGKGHQHCFAVLSARVNCWDREQLYQRIEEELRKARS